MVNTPELMVMLTHNDRTVVDAYEIFEQCKYSKAKYWGFKEIGLPLSRMKKLYALMKSCGKITSLEVVAYTEKECVENARLAVECGCDILMGTLFFDSVNEICKENNIKYMPFVGRVTGRPSVLEGDIDELTDEANACIKKGVYGFDLLGYRHSGDAWAFNRQFVSQVNAPVCIAGSINSFERLDEVKSTSPLLFTVGGAFFENKFGGSFGEQINNVCTYMEK